MVYTDRHTLMSCSHYMWAVVQTEGGLHMVCEGSQPSAAVDFSDPTHHQIPQYTFSQHVYRHISYLKSVHPLHTKSLNNFS